MLDRVVAFARDVPKLQSEQELADAIAEIGREFGFRYCALTHHVDLRRTSTAIRVHNYPKGWAEWFDERALGVTDPVHRTSNITSVGFSWSMVSTMIALTRNDRRVLKLAHAEGIGDGYAVPAYVPGEAHRSCSFACATGERFEGAGSLSPRQHRAGEAREHCKSVSGAKARAVSAMSAD